MKFLDVLSPEELDHIHGQALAVLDNVGCVIEHRETQALLQSRGARVDFAGNRVRFSEQMVEKALASTPKKYLVAGRSPFYQQHFRRGLLLFVSPGKDRS